MICWQQSHLHHLTHSRRVIEHFYFYSMIRFLHKGYSLIMLNKSRQLSA